MRTLRFVLLKMRHLSKSLRLQLLVWMLLSLAAAICINLYLSFNSANSVATLVTDHTLLASARVIAEDIHVNEGGSVEAEIPPAALEMFQLGYGDRVYYQVITAWGNLVAGFDDLPRPTLQQQGQTMQFRGETVRGIMLDTPIVGLGKNGTVTVTVAVTQAGQFALRRQLWFSDFTKQLVLLLIAGLVTILGVQRGLLPILRLRDAVRDRGRSRLEPIAPDMVQNELKPLVHALNDHMERVRDQMAAQRRFVSNAAHQLRTPLAVIATQADVAGREQDNASRDEALQALRNSTRQVTRLASQLLTLSRAEPGSRRPRNDRLDLGLTARQVLETQAEAALQRNIDLGLEIESSVSVQGDGTMIREMIVNLVDNALRYTPPGGEVTVKVLRQGALAVLSVEDNGPGIAAAERELVFERFYRIIGTQPEGSGLGLAIVREVVDGAGGSVSLRDSVSGGLLVEVSLPAVADESGT